MADLAVDNAASALIDQPLAEGLGSRAAIVTPAKSWTYGDLQNLTDRAAQGLRGLGVEPEQRVALLMPDGVEFAAAFLAYGIVCILMLLFATRQVTLNLLCASLCVVDPDVRPAGFIANRNSDQLPIR
jgi:acyl-CoA synthetase (AMP-forming)/AMP-acid ligase II